MKKNIYLTRIEEFSASHCLNVKTYSNEKNLEKFGKCTRVHGHNFEVEVTLSGPFDEETGMLINLHILKKIMKDKIVEKFDHFHLNDLEPFQKTPPTIENIAIVCWNILEKTEIGDYLYKIKVHENPRNIAVYKG